MKISSINLGLNNSLCCQKNNIHFSGSIIDAHAHWGKWLDGYYPVDILDKFVNEPLQVTVSGETTQDNIKKIIVSSLDCISSANPQDEVTGLNNAINTLKGKEKFALLAVCQPNLTNGNTEKLEQAILTYKDKIVGLKFHPEVLAKNVNGEIISPNSPAYEAYLKLAQKLRLPCLFHSQAGNSAPKVIYELAKKFNDVPVILGHTGAGADANFNEALDVLKSSLDKKDAKLYCDISWLDWQDGLPGKAHNKVETLIRELKKRNGLDRILFGTDSPLGCFGETPVNNVPPKAAYEETVSGLKTMIKDKFKDENPDEIIDKIFYKNAEDLFFKKNEQVKKLSKTKTGLIIGAVAAVAVGAVAIGIALYKKGKANKQPPQTYDGTMFYKSINEFV